MTARVSCHAFVTLVYDAGVRSRPFLAGLVAFTCQCGRLYDPSGVWIGTAKEVGKAEIDVGPGSKPGEVIVNWWNTDRPKGDVQAQIERMDERRFRVSILGCGIQFEQTAPPNDHGATVVLTPQQVCEIDIDHYKGPVYVGGTAQFDKAKGSVSLLLFGSSPSGSRTRVQWSLNYDGRAKKK